MTTSETALVEDLKATITLRGLVGSHAYGLNHAESDMDYLGTYVLPQIAFLGLKTYPETISKTNALDKSATPDTTLHEIGKFINLTLAANPTVSEVLWLNSYTVYDPSMQDLIAHRQSFLSQRIRAAYVGYARQQFKRLNERGNFSSTLKNRTGKHARHLARLVFQARHALETGEIRVLLTEDEIHQVRWLEGLCLNERDKFNQIAERMMLDVDELPSDLPKSPDVDLANDILVDIRRQF
jgi:predicted nucleotidyltransferase